MLLFIKSVNLTLNEDTGAIVISGIEYNIYTDVNQLGTSFLKIQEDFKNMEDQFDKKFDTLIRLYFQQFKEEKAKKEQGEIGKPVASSVVSEHPFLSGILPKIFFNDFLMFYDEYSYAINERIDNLHKSTFKDVVIESENVRNFKELIQSRLSTNEDYKKFKYLDLHYFRNKLETKLSTVFGNIVSEIRHILYGDYYTREAAEIHYIRLLYLHILYYRKHEFTPSGFESYFQIENITRLHIGFEKIIFDTIRKYAEYISYNLIFLYNYHQQVSRIFDVSHNRFNMYEKILDMYGSIKNAPFGIGLNEKEPFEEHDSQRCLRTPEHNFLYEELTVSAIRGDVFAHLDYYSNESLHNTYNISFNKIKNILVSIYT